MTFEQIIGIFCLSTALIGYIVYRLTRDINWAMYGYYIRRFFSTW